MQENVWVFLSNNHGSFPSVPFKDDKKREETKF